MCVCLQRTTQYQGHSQAGLMVLLERLSSRERRLRPPGFQIHVFIGNKAASHSDGFCPDAIAQSLAACQEAAAPPTWRQTTPLLPSITATARSFYLFFTQTFFFVVRKILTARSLSINRKSGGGCSSSRLSLRAHVAPTAIPGRRNERRGDDNRINTRFTGCCFE